MESELQEFDEKCSRQFDKEGHTRLADPAGLLCTGLLCAGLLCAGLL